MTKANILIVEDEGIVAEDIQSILKDLGYGVVSVASSGEEAVKKAGGTRPPDLVLMDIVLKGDMDGIEAAKQIHARLNIPVVYLTAYADKKTLERAKITEPFGYILKPFGERELYTNIEMALYRNKMEKKLKESQEWLSTTLKSIGDAVIATDKEGLIRFMNPIARGLTGWKQKEAIGRPLKDVFHIISEKTGKRIEDPVAKIIRKGIIIGLANHTLLISKDGRKMPIDDSGTPIKDREGEIVGVVLVFHDVSERKKMEEALRKVDRTLKVLSECNQVLVHSTGESDLLDRVCRIIVGAGGYRLVWVGFAQQDKAKTVRPVGQAGYEQGYLETVNITWADNKRGRGPTGTAIRTGKPCICRNILTDPSYAPWRDEATKRGYASSIALPLKAENRILGALNIYAVEPDAFNTEEVNLLMEMADDLAYGIMNLRTHIERKQTEEKLQMTLEKLRKAMNGIIQAMTLAVEMRDPYTAGHQRRVADLARAIGEEMALNEEQIDGIRMAGTIHDIGKIHVPSEILSRPGKLPQIEFNIIKVHPQIGYEILKGIDFPWPIAQIILQHHERMDGSGYPNGLSGKEIILEARILAVADVVEAMSSHRPYRAALGIDDALEEISKNRGILYDPEVVDACLKLFKEKRYKLK